MIHPRGMQRFMGAGGAAGAPSTPPMGAMDSPQPSGNPSPDSGSSGSAMSPGRKRPGLSKGPSKKRNQLAPPTPSTSSNPKLRGANPLAKRVPPKRM